MSESRTKEMWRSWGFTDKPPDNPYFYRLWKQLRMRLKKEAL